MKQGRTLISLATELERQLTTKRDLIVPTQLMHHETVEGVPTVVVETPEGIHRYPVDESCRHQLAERLGVPYKYFQRMHADQPQLLDVNVNTWLHQEPEVRMLRTLDGRARAFLSNKYQRRDNYDLLTRILPVLKSIPDVQFPAMELTSTKMYIKALSPRVRYEVAPGDIVEAGVVISNSETGHGMTAVYPLVHRLRCKNGMISADTAYRKAHVGRGIETSDTEVTIYQEDTLKADDEAFFLKIRDQVISAVSETTFALIAQKFAKTKGIKLVGDPVAAVDKLATQFLLTETERSGVLMELVKEGDLTGYGLINAVTHYAHDDAVEFARGVELEMVGGKMLAQSQKDWSALAEA